MENLLSLMMRTRRILFNCFLLFFCLLIAGCANTGKPQFYKDSYLLDYPAPVFAKQAVIDDSIRVNRFTIASAYNNSNMIFRQDDYALDSFNYNRWAVNPADMISDNLLRDLQESGFFRAAFSRYTVDEGRYILQGGVEEFFLRMDKKGNLAVIGLEITLKDTKEREATKRILFQKKYREEESLEGQTPRAYCQAMSRAMQKLSVKIIADVYQAIKKPDNK
jgi:ABC-type uncharacterized transport system auxiliary subunit